MDHHAVDNLRPRDGCGIHAEKDRVPFEPHEHRVARLVCGDRHRRRGHECWRHELQIADATDALRHEAREPHPERKEVDERVAEALEDRVARIALHGADAVLGDVPRAPAARGDAAGECACGFGMLSSGVPHRIGGRGEGHSIRLRPVRRKKTSSRLDRRTSEVIGCSPRCVICSSSASPLLV